MPPTPPPEIDLEAWDATLDELERRAPERLALIHFDVVSEPAKRPCLRANLVVDAAGGRQIVRRDDGYSHRRPEAARMAA